MQDLQLVSDVLLKPQGFTMDDLPVFLSALASTTIDAADLYFQQRISESWILEDGLVKEGSFNLDQGVGVRAIAGEKTGFSYSQALNKPALMTAIEAARSIVCAGQQGRVQVLKTQPQQLLYPIDNPLDHLDRTQKVELLQRIDLATRALDPRIIRVSVSLAGSWEHILVAANDGCLAGDIRPLVRFNVSVKIGRASCRERVCQYV